MSTTCFERRPERVRRVMSPRLAELGRVGVSIFDLCHYPYENDPAAFDPALARQVYREHFEEWLAAERLGFDAVFLSEHHFTAYNLLPSPNLMVAALASHTKRIRVGAMINVVPFHQPLRLAEESAMLDVLSDGRLEVGVGRGIDFQEVKKLGMDFDELRPRFQEGLDLMRKAWTNVEFEHHGDFYSVARAAIYPRPLQQPHPPIWAAAESPATIEWVASQGFGMSTIFLPSEMVAEKLAHYLDAAQRFEQPLGAANFMLFRNVYVAPTDDEAIADCDPALSHMMFLFQDAALPPDPALLPDSYAFHREIFGRFMEAPDTFEDILGAGIVLCGSPKTVREQLLAQVEPLGLQQLCLLFAFGNLPHEKVMRSLELFAEQVLPALRP
jgi:alkanesulfonate monooxygenase SsuD/methylene tetrahydromethanopterin reductase-like flavin-dependent oxidoreductase (luciferase family)